MKRVLGSTNQFNFRVSRELLADVAEIAWLRNETVTDVLVRALQQYVKQHGSCCLHDKGDVHDSKRQS